MISQAHHFSNRNVRGRIPRWPHLVTAGILPPCLACMPTLPTRLCVLQGDLSYKEGAPRALSFCQWVLAGDSPTVLVVEDALKDRR